MQVVPDHPSSKWSRCWAGRGPVADLMVWLDVGSAHPVRARAAVATAGSRESQLGRIWTTQDKDAKARCTEEKGSSSLPCNHRRRSPRAVNFPSYHFIYSMPQVSGWANWIKVISFCLFHLKRQHPLGDLYPLIWPFTSLFSLLLEFTHVLESAGFFFFLKKIPGIYQLISFRLLTSWAIHL